MASPKGSSIIRSDDDVDVWRLLYRFRIPVAPAAWVEDTVDNDADGGGGAKAAARPLPEEQQHAAARAAAAVVDLIVEEVVDNRRWTLCLCRLIFSFVVCLKSNGSLDLKLLCSFFF